MSVWQAALGIALAGALLSAWRRDRAFPWIIGLVLGGNLVLTALLSPVSDLSIAPDGDYRMVAVLDILCIIALISQGRREMTIAALFLPMLGAYLLAHYKVFPGETTYAIIEPLAYLQYAIAGWPNGGWSDYVSDLRLRRLAGRYSLAQAFSNSAHPRVSSKARGE